MTTDFSPTVTLDGLAAHLCAARKLVIVGHRNPDGDCIGSALALASGLATCGISAHVVSPDPLSGSLSYIPGADGVSSELQLSSDELLVSVDVSDPRLLEPLPVATVEAFQERDSLNIDHHFSNLRYARRNYVDVSAASAAEIVSQLLDHMGVQLTADSATQLMYGIVNDTHSFQNSNTGAQTLRTAAALVDAGAQLDTVVYRLLLERTQASARLWAESLPTLTFHEGGAVAWMVVSLQALEATGATVQDSDGLVDFLRNIHGVDLAVLFKQLGPDFYRLSLRSTEHVDCTRIAGVFGGGGHRRASGCDAEGSLQAIGRALLQAYREQLRA